MKKVFISSTYEDLLPYRIEVSQGLFQAGYALIRMEDFVSRPNNSLKESLKEVEEADFFVGIYAFRYGSINKEHSKSITELELCKAISLRIPVLAFLAESGMKWPKEFIDQGENAMRLNKMKKKFERIKQFLHLILQKIYL